MRLYHLSVYETPLHFYVVGSDASETKFFVLKLDRTASDRFEAAEDEQCYSKTEIGELLATISSSSVVTPTEKWNKRKPTAAGLLRTVDRAYGIVGAVRFLEGYYLLVVTKARHVVSLGYHAVYKVEDVSMIYLPLSGVPVQPDEQKYSKLFQTVDLTTNFYFSYTYDLSRTLQENCLALRGLRWNKNSYSSNMGPESKFIWNNFLLEPLKNCRGINHKWTLDLVHGYLGHTVVELPCAKLVLLLIARRAAEFAGTRFLKRGTNLEGAVANDVETEQITWDMSSSPDFLRGKFTAHVQKRGSAPMIWSQDPTTRGMVGKPPITVELAEPHALSAAKHFRRERRKYGHPIIIMNLVKRRREHDEHILHDHFLEVVRYLNQFRKPGRCLDYISFDVSKCNKSGQVLQRLGQLGLRALLSSGWFQSFPEMKSRRAPHNHWLLDGYEPLYSSDGSMILQHGISRTNCVDCLDRTNVVQFGIGKVALAAQLYSMGYLEEPLLSLNSELCRALEECYDEHGNTLAWQYAGSQLVHSIKTYKRTSVLQERGRDVFQTLSRYYSNTFSDYEKQDGINIFLGIFRPLIHSRIHLWAGGLGGSDRYLHYSTTRVVDKSAGNSTKARRRDNEFLRWSVNFSSDYEEEKDGEEEGGNESPKSSEGIWAGEKEEGGFKEWMMVRAEEANVQLSNDFVANASAKSSGCSPEPWDSFALAHRTFELTSFDQLLRDSPYAPWTTPASSQSKRMISLSGLNQTLFQTTSFMRIFKSPEPSSKKSSQSSGRPREDVDVLEVADDDEDERGEQVDGEDDVVTIGDLDGVPQILQDLDLRVEEDRNSRQLICDPVWRGPRSPTSALSRTIPTKRQLHISIGLKSPQEAYYGQANGADIWEKEPSREDMAKYKRYVAIAQLSRGGAQPGKVKRGIALRASNGMRGTFCKLEPMFEFQPSFFTADTAFHTELRDVPQADMEIYRKSVDLSTLRPSPPGNYRSILIPEVSKRLYEEYPEEYARIGGECEQTL